jgi:hypothetical protein
MAKKVTRSRPWTKEELRMLKTAHAREDKDRDCAEAEAERRCDVWSGDKAGCDMGGDRERKETW